MAKAISIVVLSLCILAAASVVVMTPTFVRITSNDSEGWGSYFFGLGAVPLIAVNGLLLAIGAILSRKNSRQLNLISVCVSGITLAVVVLAWILVEPLRQWIIFGR
jgi:hypothetical protein